MTSEPAPRPVPGWVLDAVRAAEIAETTTPTDEDRAQLVAAAHRILDALDPLPTRSDIDKAKETAQTWAAAVATGGFVAGAHLRSTEIQALGGIGAAQLLAVLMPGLQGRRCRRDE